MNFDIDFIKYNICKTVQNYKIIIINKDDVLLKRKYVINKLFKYRNYTNYFKINEFYKAVDIFNKYIHINHDNCKQDFLLVLCICIFIVVKFDDDLFTFNIDNINNITNNIYTTEQIIYLEKEIIQFIDHKIFFYSIFNYNHIFKEYLEINKERHILIDFLSDYALLSSSLIRFNNFIISISVIILSNLKKDQNKDIESNIKKYTDLYYNKLELKNYLLEDKFVNYIIFICNNLIRSIKNNRYNNYLFKHKDNVYNFYKHEYFFNKYNYNKLIKKFIKNAYSSTDL